MPRFNDSVSLTFKIAVFVTALLSVAFFADGKNPNRIDSAAKTTAADTVINKQEKNDNIIYITPYLWKNPEFPGGDVALYKYIREVMVYPDEALKDSVEGRVIVEFVITETGKVTGARVVRGRHPALDKEALRIVNSFPDWTPGIEKVNGSPSRVIYHLPVTFRIKDQCQDKK